MMSLPIHGDPDVEELAALGLDPDKVLDFSVCVNPYGPSPRVREALLSLKLDRYPDRKSLKLRQALVDLFGAHAKVGVENIIMGNGVSELIWLTCLAFLKPADRVLIPQPTYGEYARSAAMMGASVVPVPMDEESSFVLDPEKFADALRRTQPRMVFLCNPNNPTGHRLESGAIADWAERWPECLFVIDEAYLAFADPAFLSDGLALAPMRNNLVLRSMTKDFALTGLRLGYAVGAAQVIESLGRVQPPWSVNAMAQAAGLAALGDMDHVRRTLRLLVGAKASLMRELAELGLPPLGTAANFFLLRVGDAARFRRLLLEQGMLVRDGTSFGLPEYVRIAVRLPEDNHRLIEAIRYSEPEA